MQHSFTFNNTGNVALRRVALYAAFLTHFICTPPIIDPWPVNSATTCQAVHRVYQGEVEAGVYQLEVEISTINRLPVESASTSWYFSQWVQLTPLEMATVPSLSLAFESSCASAPIKARKHLADLLDGALPGMT